MDLRKDSVARITHASISVSADAEDSALEFEEGEERRAALRLLSHPADYIQSARALPVLATAGDVREVVQFLKKRPNGVTIVEALDADKKRVFEPRKVSAYEFWGIVSRSNDRLKLSPLGYEFARKLEPEAHIYRSIIDDTPAYRSALEWINEQQLDLITHTDVAAYWRANHTEAVNGNDEKAIESSVVCFFHLCQAAELGTVTIGKRGQPARLRIDKDELMAYSNTKPQLRSENPSFTDGATYKETSPTVSSISSHQLPARTELTNAANKLCVYISCAKQTRIVNQLQVGLQLTDIECRVVEGAKIDDVPVSAIAFSAMRECDAGLFIITSEEFKMNSVGEYALDERVLVEIGAAFVLFDRRVMLLWDQHLPVPGKLQGLSFYKHQESNLTWDVGMQLMKVIKDFKDNAREHVKSGERTNPHIDMLVD